MSAKLANGLPLGLKRGRNFLKCLEAFRELGGRGESEIYQKFPPLRNPTCHCNEIESQSCNQPSLEAYCIYGVCLAQSLPFLNEECHNPKQQQLHIYIYTVHLSVEMLHVN